jgi:hypothetical protein
MDTVITQNGNIIKGGFSLSSIKQQEQNIDSSKLFALIAGVRGQGKSVNIGTLNVPTLLITSTMESHGVKSAKLFGGELITSVFYDLDDAGKSLKPDSAITRLHTILDYLISLPDLLTHYTCIAIDSITSVDTTILATTRLTQANGFDAPKFSKHEHLRVLQKLKELHRRGVHIIVTMGIMATFTDGNLYRTAKPVLYGTTTTDTVTSLFDEVLVIVKQDTEYLYQMDLRIKKAGKEVSGDEKQIAFYPRIAGIADSQIVDMFGDGMLIPANLAYIYKLKQGSGQ